MSDENKLERNCGQCVHCYAIPSVPCCSKDRDDMTLGLGPHDCPHWQPSDAHRVAEAAAGIEMALMVLAGLWAVPEADGEAVDQWTCPCGVTLQESRSEAETGCPACGLSFSNDGQGNWAPVAK